MTSLGTILILLLSLLHSVWGEQEISLLFAGDAMQHGPQINAARRSDGSFNYSSCFALLEDEIKGADYAVVNLECPLGGEPYSGYPAFSAPDDFARQLRDSGFDLLLTANNHCLDRRDAGLRRTISTLDDLGIPHTGTFLSRKHREETSPMIVDVKGVRIAMLSYTYGTNGIPIQGTVAVNYIDRTRISADIDTARQRGAQLVCVNLHWGIEYQLLPVESQRSLADWLVEEKGVDLIIGGHPHVIEPMEIRHSQRYNKDVLLVYSMGNFISNQNGDDSRGGAMVLVGITTQAGQVKSITASYRLFFCQKPLRQAKSTSYDTPEADPTNYQLIPAHRADLIRPDSRQAFNLFMQNARRIFDAHNVMVTEAPKSGELPLHPYLDCNISTLLLK